MKFSTISIASFVALALADHEANATVTESSSTLVTITSCEGGCNVSSWEGGANKPFIYGGAALAAGALLAL